MTEAHEPGRESRVVARYVVARYVAASVVIVAFVVLAALAIAASRSSVQIGAAPERVAPDGRDRESARPAEPPAAQPGGSPAPPTTPAIPPSASAAVPDSSAPEAPPAGPSTPGAGTPCAALSLPAPQEVGGLQSMVRLIPLLGPFSPEAFAMVPALEPGLRVLGPLFPIFEDGLDRAAPALDVVTPVVQQLGEAGFGAFAPFYGPYREDVLASEAQLAARLQVITEALATAPGTGCVVGLEGLVADLIRSGGAP